MMPDILVLAQQRLNFFDVARDGLRELYLFFMQTIRDGRIVWVLVIIAGIIVYKGFGRR